MVANTSPLAPLAPLAPSAHPFAELGPGPYKLIGVEDTAMRAEVNSQRENDGLSFTTNLCGGSCDLCGTSIWNVFVFKCVNGVKFKTGEICAEKANRPDESASDYAVRAAARALKAQINKAKLVRKHANDATKIAAADQWIGENREALDAIDHPRGFEGLSFLDYLRWMFDHSGVSGKLKASRAAYAALGQKMPRLARR